MHSGRRLPSRTAAFAFDWPSTLKDRLGWLAGRNIFLEGNMIALNLLLKVFSVRLMTVMIAVCATSAFATPISFADGTMFMR